MRKEWHVDLRVERKNHYEARSNLGRAAVHEELDPIDEAALVRGEEKDGGGDFLRRAGTPERRGSRGLGFELLDLLVGESQLALVPRRHYGARSHDVNADISIPEIHGPGPRK
jgi:hypothetical protein